MDGISVITTSLVPFDATKSTNHIEVTFCVSNLVLNCISFALFKRQMHMYLYIFHAYFMCICISTSINNAWHCNKEKKRYFGEGLNIWEVRIWKRIRTMSRYPGISYMCTLFSDIRNRWRQAVYWRILWQVKFWAMWAIQMNI